VLDLAAAVMARIFAAADAELGTDALERYARQAADLAAEGLSGDSFASAIQAAITGGFEVTAGELLAKVTAGDPEWKAPKHWPGSARAVTGKLAGSHRRSARSAERFTTSAAAATATALVKISPVRQTEKSGEDARAGPHCPHDESGAGNAGNGRHDAGTSPSDRQEEKPPACPRHQTRWGPRQGCLDCRGARRGGPAVTGAETIGNRPLAARARDLADHAEPGTLARKAADAVADGVRVLRALAGPRDCP
jgi:hypothetical protein